MSAPPRRILVVKLATLGDLLLATPALRALRTSFPNAHIGVLAPPSSAVAVRGLDSFDRLVTFDKYAFDRPLDALGQLPRALGFALRLRRGGWDTLVLLHHLTTRFGTVKYAALCLGSGASRRVGLDNGRGWFLTAAAPDHGYGWRHEADYALDVVGVLGARLDGPPKLELCIAPADEHWALARWRELVPDQQPVALLAPGSGAYSRARRWAPERFVQVGQALRARDGLRPLVLSGLDPDEQVLAASLAAHLGAGVVPPAPTPQALAALLRRCRLLVSNDSGPVHLAAAVHTPVVAIFGPSNERAWRPYPVDAPSHQVVREQLACAPCIHRGHAFGTPQGCPARTCLALVDAPAVLTAAERALAAAGPSGAEAEVALV